MLKGKIKKILIFIITIVGVLFIYFIYFSYIGFDYNQNNEKLIATDIKNKIDVPKVISTDPNPLENSIFLPTQELEITFSHPIENVGEFKYKIDPQVNLQITLSDDRKTVKISQEPSFKLGTTYTITVSKETKFDGGKRLENDILYHFRTIDYKGV